MITSSVDSEGNPLFLSAEWRHLLMLNYEIDPAIVQPYVPAGTEIDFHEGKTYCSIVGFLFLDTKVLGVPIPFHRNFEEVNLRFYVRHKGPEGWRRGVVFIKELVPRFAIAWTARVFYNENYESLPMSHNIGKTSDRLDVEYSWKPNGREDRIAAIAIGDPMDLVEGSEEQFIAEHYWGYNIQKNKETMEYRVEHPPWRVWRTENARLECDVALLYGDQFARVIGPNPDSAFIAEGSRVQVYKGRPIARKHDE